VVRLKETDRFCVIEVQDNGLGLPSEHPGRLTEPYVTTREKGTGLGLAIVKKIMEEHGGSLVMRNQPGGGASVELAFPVGQAMSGTAAE
jgi:two-component system nitrogen regulation sensor histidine kinase NtrY